MKPSEVAFKLSMALTSYDRKQSTKKSYNIYALPQYMQAASRVEKYLEMGYDLRLSIVNCFCGPLLDKMLKLFGLELQTKEEKFGIYKKLPEIE